VICFTMISRRLVCASGTLFLILTMGCKDSSKKAATDASTADVAWQTNIGTPARQRPTRRTSTRRTPLTPRHGLARVGPACPYAPIDGGAAPSDIDGERRHRTPTEEQRHRHRRGAVLWTGSAWWHGQSLAVGQNGNPPKSKTQPYGNLKLSTAPWRGRSIPMPRAWPWCRLPSQSADCRPTIRAHGRQHRG